MEPLIEVNFDGLVGPTHNYAGLSSGNIASQRHRHQIAQPKAAALQGLAKAKALADRGFPQAILPPHPRPAWHALRAWGFDADSPAAILAAAAQQAPAILAAACSASAMWTANAATVTPAIDAADRRTHFTPANLFAKPHRAIEPAFTHAVFAQIFRDPRHFVVHPPLQGGDAFADEGAANHTRFFADPSQPGLHLFVFGRHALQPNAPAPTRFPARQTAEAAQAIARRHHIPPQQCCFLQQHPAAIDAGVFHNDVIAVGHHDVLFCHERAFLDGDAALAALQAQFLALTGTPLRILQVPEATVSLNDAVQSYLFNSQLLSRPDGRCLLVAPTHCRELPPVRQFLDACTQNPRSPIAEVLFQNLQQSMANGGGPACLRLRVPLSQSALKALNGRVLLDSSLFADLARCIQRHYPDSLSPADLASPALADRAHNALLQLQSVFELDLSPVPLT